MALLKSCSRLVPFLLLLASACPTQARDVILYVDNPAAAAASNKAHQLEKKGNLDGAIGYYSAAIKADPRMYVATYSRGCIYMVQHKWEQAISDFNGALIVSPSFLLAAIKRAEANQSLGRYDKALTELNHIIGLRPRIHTDALARSNRAWLRANLSQPRFPERPASRGGRQHGLPDRLMG